MMRASNAQAFRLPTATQIGHAHLQISDLPRALRFYRDVLGFKEITRQGEAAVLSATGRSPAHVLLSASAHAKPKPPRTTGLFHVAIRYPNRRELARIFRRLLKNEWPFQGFSDHGVSEALYLADPDGNGLELYADRPREQWRWHGAAVVMFTEPLQVDSLLSEAANDSSSAYMMPAQTDIGHVHLHVSDLKKAESFYGGVLGWEVTQRSYPGALFLSAGGYHHHVGLNVWAGQGAPPPPPEAVGLLSFSMRIPDNQTLELLSERFGSAGVPFEDRGAPNERRVLFAHDQDGNGVEIVEG